MRNWSLNSKVMSLIAIFTVACVGIATLGLMKMHEIKEEMNNVISGPVRRIGISNELRALFLIQQINQKNYVLEATAEGRQVQLKRLNDREAQLKQKLEEYEKATVSAQGRKAVADFREVYTGWRAVTDVVIKDCDLGNLKEAAELCLNKSREFRLKGEEILDGLLSLNQDQMQASVVESESDYQTAFYLKLIFASASVLSGLAIAMLVLRGLNRAIDQVIANLSDSTNQVTSAANQIASSSVELSHATTEQASTLEETAASIEEMNSMVQKSSESSAEASSLAGTSMDNAERGKRVVHEVIQAISDIDTSNNQIMEEIQESNQRISDIVKVIAEIGEKTKVINDIVFQTKLLSFNASVEAARAGEHGKGFAVVAEEVGNLAQMSGNAAKEISAMLGDSIQKVESIVSDTKEKAERLMLTGKTKVETGTQVARQCGEVLDELVKGVRTVADRTTEISNACREQSVGVQEITKVITQLDQVTQTNAASSEEAASAAEELSAQAESLRRVVGILVATIKGGEPATGGGQARIGAGHSGNVVPLRAPVAKRAVSAVSFKKAAGSDLLVPSESDPRFEEV